MAESLHWLELIRAAVNVAMSVAAWIMTQLIPAPALISKLQSLAMAVLAIIPIYNLATLAITIIRYLLVGLLPPIQ
jgi:hypothetical protein